MESKGLGLRMGKGCGLGCGEEWFQWGRQSKRMEVRAMTGSSLRREGGWVVWELATEEGEE